MSIDKRDKLGNRIEWKNQIVRETLTSLPTIRKDLDEEFMSMTSRQIRDIIRANVVEELPVASQPIKNGTELFKDVLVELDKLKDKLGGSPTFRQRTPTLDAPDANQSFFGVPMPAVKDWLRMTLKKEWLPQFFWSKIGALFGVTKNGLSQYEEAHLRIQRFGILINNKEYFTDILDRNDEDHFSDLSKFTGLAWHPTQNGVGVEKIYIDFTEQFLIEYFEDAKNKGEEALIEYFKAFDGVCFEDRARCLEEYTKTHPLANQVIEDVSNIADWDSSDKANDVFMKEASLMAIKSGIPPTPTELFDHLKNKGIFEIAFMTDEGIKAKPTEEGFREWAKEQIDMCVLSEEENHGMVPF